MIHAFNNIVDFLPALHQRMVMTTTDGQVYRYNDFTGHVGINKGYSLVQLLASNGRKSPVGVSHPSLLVAVIPGDRTVHIDCPKKLTVPNDNGVAKSYELISVIESKPRHVWSRIRMPSGQWYNVDNSAVEKIKEENVVDKQTRVLFYKLT